MGFIAPRLYDVNTKFPGEAFEDIPTGAFWVVDLWPCRDAEIHAQVCNVIFFSVGISSTECASALAAREYKDKL